MRSGIFRVATTIALELKIWWLELCVVRGSWLKGLKCASYIIYMFPLLLIMHDYLEKTFMTKTKVF